MRGFIFFMTSGNPLRGRVEASHPGGAKRRATGAFHVSLFTFHFPEQ
jgi:hypothetical protein